MLFLCAWTARYCTHFVYILLMLIPIACSIEWIHFFSSMLGERVLRVSILSLYSYNNNNNNNDWMAQNCVHWKLRLCELFRSLFPFWIPFSLSLPLSLFLSDACQYVLVLPLYLPCWPSFNLILFCHSTAFNERSLARPSDPPTAIVITNATPTKTNWVTYYALHAFSFNFIEELSLTFSLFSIRKVQPLFIPSEHRKFSVNKPIQFFFKRIFIKSLLYLARFAFAQRWWRWGNFDVAMKIYILSLGIKLSRSKWESERKRWHRAKERANRYKKATITPFTENALPYLVNLTSWTSCLAKNITLWKYLTRKTNSDNDDNDVGGTKNC